MTIPQFITGVTANISNKIKPYSIPPPIVGGAFVDLANLLSGQTSNIQTGVTFINSLLTGGTTGQVFSKVDNTNYNVHWVTPSSGGTSSTGINGLTGTTNIGLGGIITTATTIHINTTDQANTLTFAQVWSNEDFGGGKGTGTFIFQNGGFQAVVYDTDFDENSEISLTSSDFQIERNDNASGFNISFDLTGGNDSGEPIGIGLGLGNTSSGTSKGFAWDANSDGILINETVTNIGLLYANDYSLSGKTNPLWIPNWGAVTGLTTGSSLNLTTTGTTGPSSLIGNHLNIPQYAGSAITFSSDFNGTGTSGSPITISTGLTTYIQSQNLISQTGGTFWIGGNGRIDGGLQVAATPSGNTDVIRLIDTKNYKKEMYVIGVNEVIFPMQFAGTLYSLTGSTALNSLQFKTGFTGTYANLPGSGTTYTDNTDMYITYNYVSQLQVSGWLRLIGKDN